MEDRLYGTEPGLQTLAALDWDAPVAAARLLGADVATQLGPVNHSDLMARWSALDLNILARDFVLPAGAGRAFRREAALLYAGELGYAP